MDGDELYIGAEGIAVALYGEVEGRKQTNVRRVYYAISNGGLPVFKVGGRIHARKSTIIRWIEKQEASTSGGQA